LSRIKIKMFQSGSEGRAAQQCAALTRLLSPLIFNIALGALAAAYFAGTARPRTPWKPLQLEPDMKLTCVKIDVWPAQAQGLALDPACEPDRPPGRVVSVGGALQDRPCLLLVQGGFARLA
jgi:hypothetical protein